MRNRSAPHPTKDHHPRGSAAATASMTATRPHDTGGAHRPSLTWREASPLR
ncbi:Hypothetical protein A7982_09607 [Minicystis rosea]|nr:Hypothetical protein A7982_09607 [Minicystis rosea]